MTNYSDFPSIEILRNMQYSIHDGIYVQYKHSHLKNGKEMIFAHMFRPTIEWM